jgi:hypothetical protein
MQRPVSPGARAIPRDSINLPVAVKLSVLNMVGDFEDCLSGLALRRGLHLEVSVLRQPCTGMRLRANSSVKSCAYNVRMARRDRPTKRSMGD